VANDNEQVNRLVNEQTEIGILLALPGLLATLVFAPWLMHLFYTAEFLSGAELLPWFVVGVFGSIILFPMGFIQRAKGAVRWIYIGQSWASLSNLILACIFTPSMGILGAAYAYLLSIALHSLVVYFIARHLSRFVWTRTTFRLVASSFCLIFVCLAVKKLPGSIMPLIFGAVLVGGAVVFSLRGIAARLGSNHRIVKIVCNIPWGRVICGLR
jgi:antigen flippase